MQVIKEDKEADNMVHPTKNGFQRIVGLEKALFTWVSQKPRANKIAHIQLTTSIESITDEPKRAIKLLNHSLKQVV